SSPCAIVMAHFERCSNLAPASWSAAVPSAALTPRPLRNQKSVRKDRRTPKASPFRGIVDVMEFRHFEACWNLALASWSAAVFSAALTPRPLRNQKIARKDMRTPKAPPYRATDDITAVRHFEARSNLQPE